jgi:hypothetical protein
MQVWSLQLLIIILSGSYVIQYTVLSMLIYCYILVESNLLLEF